MIKRLAIIAFLAVGLFGYHTLMAKVGFGTSLPPVPIEQRADAVRVLKSERRMDLLRAGKVLSSYQIVLGAAADDGRKQREGDEKTPEGQYVIDWRNPRSKAHLSLHISYPNAEDQTVAAASGYAPGGDIMIHRLPNGWGWFGPIHHFWDWTDGCIAVTNAEMNAIWAKVPDLTPIEILP